MEQYFGATHISHRDGNGTGSRRGRPIPLYQFYHVYFFQFSNSSHLKKLNETGQDMRMGKFPYPIMFTFDFYFWLFFIILKLIYFIKNKNIMNFYKLFINKYSNYYYYLY